MSTIIRIHKTTVPLCYRSDAQNNSKLERALAQSLPNGIRREVVCLCEGGENCRLIPFFREGRRGLRRVSKHDKHGPECPYRLPLPDEDEPNFGHGLLAKDQAPKGSSPSDGEGIRRRPARSFLAGPPRHLLESRQFAYRLLNLSHTFAWLRASERQLSGFGCPAWMDFVHAVPLALHAMAGHSMPIHELLRARGCRLEIGIIEVPESMASLSNADEPGYFFATIIPIEEGELRLRNTMWVIPPGLVRDMAVDPEGQDARLRLPLGLCLAAVALDAKGQCADFCLTPAGQTAGEIYPRGSNPEQRLKEHFSRQGRVACQVSDLADVRRLAERIGIPVDIATALKHRPDFVCPATGAKTVFVEATSFEHGPLAEDHRRDVLSRCAHYLDIGCGRIAIELWQLAGPIPQQLTRIETPSDLRRAKDAYLVNF